MDPNKVRDRILEIITRYATEDAVTQTDEMDAVLTEFETLDASLSKGGTLPDAWAKAKAPDAPTKVLFRWWQDEVIALFPQHAGSTLHREQCLSYQRLGQHGSADLVGIIRTSRPATPAEYESLAKELRDIGYRLDIAKRTGPKDTAMRHAELKR